MEFYAGMGDALAGRLYGLRNEGRNTAGAGVRARACLLRAMAMNAELADADLGLGLYNYYVDTLSAAARVLRFFMGIPGGSKKEGIRQLQVAIEEGELASPEARFYLAINLHNYDQQSERALEVIGPLGEKYPSNALFQLAQGDLFAKLGRKKQPRDCYQPAARATLNDPECRHDMQKLAESSAAPSQPRCTLASWDLGLPTVSESDASNGIARDKSAFEPKAKIHEPCCFKRLTPALPYTCGGALARHSTFPVYI